MAAKSHVGYIYCAQALSALPFPFLIIASLFITSLYAKCVGYAGVLDYEKTDNQQL